MNILAFLTAPFVALGVALGSLFAPQVVVVPQTVEVPTYVEVPQLGASEAVPVVVAFFETTLASAITSSATSFTLTSATDKDGNTLASSTYAFVIDEGSSNEEVVIADCTGTVCTNALRGVSALTGNTEVTALKKAHRRGASVKITDAPILMLVSRALRGEDVTNFTPVGNGSLVDKQYVDGVALGGGAVPATTVDDGIVELATEAETIAGSSTSDSGSPLVVQALYAPSIVQIAAPAGSIIAFASSTAPTGWLVADGSTYSTSTYPDLFLAIGYAYGGNGTSTFAVPDLKGRNIIGYGSATTTFDTMGETGGEDVHVQTIPELAAHSHPFAGVTAGGSGTAYTAVDDTSNAVTSTTGSSTPFNVMDPYIVLRYIIKY